MSTETLNMTWKNEDGTYTTAFRIPRFFRSDVEAKVIVNMIAYTADYIKKYDVVDYAKWDRLTDDTDFCREACLSFGQYLANICIKENLDFEEHAKLLNKNVLDLIDNNDWYDIIAQKTGLTYECLPILGGIARNLQSNANFWSEEIRKHKECA